MDRSSDITAHLLAWSQGDQAAGGALLDAVYHELRRLAGSYLRRERRDHSLPPTALVHEAYLKLVDQRRGAVAESGAFLRHRRAGRCGASSSITLGLAAPRSAEPEEPCRCRTSRLGVEPLPVDLVALDEALEKLAEIDQRQTRLVELRFFGGLTIEETAEILRISPATVKRDWALARAWLYRELQGSSG